MERCVSVETFLYNLGGAKIYFSSFQDFVRAQNNGIFTQN